MPTESISHTTMSCRILQGNVRVMIHVPVSRCRIDCSSTFAVQIESIAWQAEDYGHRLLSDHLPCHVHPSYGHSILRKMLRFHAERIPTGCLTRQRRRSLGGWRSHHARAAPMDSSAATFVQQHPLRKNAVRGQRQVKTVRRQSINRGPSLFPWPSSFFL